MITARAGSLSAGLDQSGLDWCVKAMLSGCNINAFTDQSGLNCYYKSD